MTNITALHRLRDAKKALQAKDSQKERALPLTSNPRARAMVILLLLSVGFYGFRPVSQSFPKTAARMDKDSFPIPQVSKNQLFYLQKTTNTNTIVCELNVDETGRIREEEPVHVFWIRYKEDGQREELSFIQRTFAYGIKSRNLGAGQYEIHFVSYKKKPFYLIKSDHDNQYHAWVHIDKKLAILKRIFLKINEGGSFWSPNIEYIEIRALDPVSGQELIERNKV